MRTGRKEMASVSMHKRPAGTSDMTAEAIPSHTSETLPRMLEISNGHGQRCQRRTRVCQRLAAPARCHISADISEEKIALEKSQTYCSRRLCHSTRLRLRVPQP